MSQGVTYADLRFVRSPREAKKRSPPAEPGAAEEEEEEEEGGGAELTYENVRRGPPTPRQDPQEQTAAAAGAARGGFIGAGGLGPWTWPLALALLGTGLFLLAGAIGLGIRYWQVSRQLQQASEGHSAEWEALAKTISSKEGQLDEARAELGSTRLTLQDCRTAGNSTQERLQGLERELRLAKGQLAVLQEEKTRTEEELHRARSCQQRVCCPLGWELFWQKCLWISWRSKTWEESKEDCEGKASHLVVLKESQEARDLWVTILSPAAGSSVLPHGAWIGLKETYPRDLFWVDNSPYEGTKTPSNYKNGYCVKINNWSLSFDYCARRLPYICEKAASPAWPALAPGQ